MRAFLTATLVLAILSSTAQTTLYTEDFETGGTSFDLNTADASSGNDSKNSWYINNVFAGGNISVFCIVELPPIFIPAITPQPAAIANSPESNYLHISSTEAVNDGVTCASFQAPDVFGCATGGNTFSGMNSDIDCSGFEDINISFYWLSRGSAATYGELMYSTDNGTSWTVAPGIYNLSTLWLEASVSLPEWDNVSSLRFGFRFVNNSGGIAPADPGMCVDEIVVTGTGLAPSVSTGTVATGPFCPEDILDVPYTAVGAFGGANVFTAQLSDENGDFTTPTAIGTAVGGAGSGVISCTLPAVVTPGTMFRIRVASSDPVIEENDNGNDITIETCGAEGCTDPLAYNYDPAAVTDSGCCFYLDTSLICGPGTVWNNTLGHCEIICQPDLDHNLSIGTGDLLLFLAVFGTNCP